MFGALALATASVIGTVGSAGAQVEIAAGSDTMVSGTGAVVPVPRASGKTGLPAIASKGGPRIAATSPVPSAGGVDTHSIIPPDGRFRPNPNDDPFYAIGTVQSSFPGGSTAACTGFLIASANTVMTAGRCVFNPATHEYATPNAIVFAPSRRGVSTPFGTCTAANLSDLYTSGPWFNSGSEFADWGFIKLRSCTIGGSFGSGNIGDLVGAFGVAGTNANLNGLGERIAGYTSDRSPGVLFKSKGVIKASGQTQLFYRNDTSLGERGAPLYKFVPEVCGGHCALAVHTTGRHGTGNHLSYNHGTRFNLSLFNFIDFVTSQP